MRGLQKIRRLAGIADISANRLREFLSAAASAEAHSPADDAKRSLAVVVPCFGHARFLNTTLTSIVAQTRLPDEVILIDDCSPDGSGQLIEGFIEDRARHGCGRFRLLRNRENRGQAASLNRGIGSASSDLIMILNDDDYLMHDAVATTFELFDRFREVALIGGSSIHFSSDDELVRSGKSISDHVAEKGMVFEVRRPDMVPGYRTYNDLNMTHSGCSFLKSAWESAGGYYSERRKRLVPFSDRDFQLRVNALFPIAVSGRVPFSFWRSGSSVDAGRNS